MSGVYVAFLGTNDYLECTYFKGDKELPNVRFVQEATLHFFCQDWTSDDRIRNRDIASQAVTIYLKRLPQAAWKEPSASNPEITQNFLELYRTEEILVCVFDELSNYRNDLNHAGFRSNAMSADKFDAKLSELLGQTKKYIAV